MSVSTQRTYREHLRRFPEYFEQLGYDGVYSSSAISREMVLRFKYEGLGFRGKKFGKRLAVTTRAMDMGLLRSFLGFEGSPLAADGKLWRFRGECVKPTNRRWLQGKTEVQALLNAASPGALPALVLLAYGGLRSAEVRAVTFGHLSLTMVGVSKVRVPGKGDKPRSVILPPLARNVLLAAALGKAPEDRVFPFGREKLARDIDRACARAGIRHYSPHDLRRTYAP